MIFLITGSLGVIGSDLVDEISKKHFVYAFYRSARIKKNSKNIKWIQHDFRKFYKKKLYPTPDIVINCIATHEFSKNKRLKNYKDSNIYSVKNLIKFSKKNNVKLFVNLSTVSVYRSSSINQLTENLPKDQKSTLAKTKLSGEKIINNSGLNYVNLRLPGILSKHNRVKNRPWLNMIINKAKQNKAIKVFNLNSKFNNVVDSIEIARLILHIVQQKKYLIKENFNFTCSNPLTLKKIIIMIKKELKSKSKIININSKKDSFIISYKKIQNKLKFYPISTKEVIKRKLNILKNENTWNPSII